MCLIADRRSEIGLNQHRQMANWLAAVDLIRVGMELFNSKIKKIYLGFSGFIWGLFGIIESECIYR